MNFLRTIALPIALGLVFLAVAIHVLPAYGPTFDAVLGDYGYGEYLWQYVRSGDESWLDFERSRLDFQGHADHPLWQLTYHLKFVYPVPSILSAIGCEYLARRWHWLNPIDAHHFIAPLSFALLLVLIYRFVERRAGGFAALLAVLAMATHPQLFGNAMNNIKDMPTLCVVYAALFAYVRVLETGSRSALLLGALLTGVGLATKLNAIWPPCFFAIVFLTQARCALLRDPATRRRFLPAVVAAPLVMAAAYLVCSPQYRVFGFDLFVEHTRFALFENTRSETHDDFLWEPILNLWRTSPLAFLPLAGIGFAIALKRQTFRTPTLVLLALLGTIPVLRPCFPGMRYYNLIRHFLEVLPIAAIGFGIGTAALARAIASRITRSATAQGALCATLAALPILANVYSTASVHPFQTSYFNAGVGGLGGAQAQGIVDADDYWCHSCRRTVEFLNENADRSALVLDPFAPWMIESLAPAALRSDLKFVAADSALQAMLDAGMLRADRDRARWEAAPVVIVTYVPQSRRFHQKTGPRVELMHYLERNLEPWRVIRCDGGEIVRFYRIETVTDAR